MPSQPLRLYQDKSNKERKKESLCEYLKKSQSKSAQ